MTDARPPMLRRPLDLPLGRARAALASWDGPAFLEGGPDLGLEGRWTILAARPRRILESRTGAGFRWSGGTLDMESECDALEGLAAVARQYRLAQPEDYRESEDCPFQGGLIGHLGYDLAPTLERLPRRAAPDSRLPTLRFGLYDTFIVVDHRDGSAELRAVDLMDDDGSDLADRLDGWLRDLESFEPRAASPGRLSPPRPEVSRADYLVAVRKALGYIRAGDIFQANLSQRWVAEGRADPFALYDRLRAESPAPYSAFLAWDDCALVGSSPELFYRTLGDSILTRPIKGTRPRSPDPVEDAALAAALIASEKDRAELTMIIDLERNDLGRVCRFGSVRVAEAGRVESFVHVHHLVASVQGRLGPGVGPVDVIRAVFPGGSITGAPKIRAMEVIDELEPTRRSAYTGALGYLGRGGRSAFNIAIRTILVEGDRVTYQVGGGIVADSDPEAEYQETLDKARGMRRAVESFGDRG